MAGITGVGTTFNLPNFVGQIYGITPEDTPLLSAIGGLTGGKQVNAKEWEWQFYDLRTPGQNVALEGDDAPDGEERVRSNERNVVQVHQEVVEISYTKLAAVGQIDASSVVLGTNPVTDEEAWQLEQMQKQIARDIEYSFINGTFQNPVNNSTPRKTRGILAAITTNVTDLFGGNLTVDAVLDTMQAAWENGGLQEGQTRTAVMGATLKRALTVLFIKDQNYRQMDRNIAGVNVTSIETEFGTLNVMLNRYMPVDEIAFLSLEDLAPCHLLIPGKGFLFAEPLAKTGSSERTQIYGEVGLEYGNQRKHAKIVNAAGSIS